jgi:hypothetical protein
MHTDAYGLVYTMDHEVGPWKMAFLHGPTSWSNIHGPISLKIRFTKPWGPSLGVNQMWTGRNDHAPKWNVLIFFNMCSKRAILKRKETSSLTILLSSSSLPRKDFSLRNHNNIFFAMDLLPLPSQNPLDRVNG